MHSPKRNQPCPGVRILWPKNEKEFKTKEDRSKKFKDYLENFDKPDYGPCRSDDHIELQMFSTLRKVNAAAEAMPTFMNDLQGSARNIEELTDRATNAFEKLSSSFDAKSDELTGTFKKIADSTEKSTIDFSTLVEKVTQTCGVLQDTVGDFRNMAQSHTGVTNRVSSILKIALSKLSSGDALEAGARGVLSLLLKLLTAGGWKAAVVKQWILIVWLFKSYKTIKTNLEEDSDVGKYRREDKHITRLYIGAFAVIWVPYLTSRAISFLESVFSKKKRSESPRVPLTPDDSCTVDQPYLTDDSPGEDTVELQDAGPVNSEAIISTCLVAMSMAAPDSPFTDVTKALARATSVTRGTKASLDSVESIMQFLPEAMSNMFYSLFPSRLEGGISRSFSEQIIEARGHLDRHNSKPQDIVTDPSFSQDVVRNYNNIYKNHWSELKRISNAQVTTMVQRIIKDYKDVRDAALDAIGATPTRQEPLGIFVHGIPGIGKTRSIVDMISLLWPEHESFQYYADNDNRHDDGYIGQPAFLKDEFAAIEPDQDQLARYLELISSKKYIMNMASLKSGSAGGGKGTAFSSKLVALISNRPYSDHCMFKALADKGALYRRFTGIEVKCKETFMIKDNRTRLKPDVKRIHALKGKNSTDYVHLDFNVYEMTQRGPGQNWEREDVATLNFPGLVVWAAARIEDRKRQHDAIRLIQKERLSMGSDIINLAKVVRKESTQTLEEIADEPQKVETWADTVAGSRSNRPASIHQSNRSTVSLQCDSETESEEHKSRDDAPDIDLTPLGPNLSMHDPHVAAEPSPNGFEVRVNLTPKERYVIDSLKPYLDDMGYVGLPKATKIARAYLIDRSPESLKAMCDWFNTVEISKRPMAADVIRRTIILSKYDHKVIVMAAARAWYSTKGSTWFRLSEVGKATGLPCRPTPAYIDCCRCVYRSSPRPEPNVTLHRARDMINLINENSKTRMERFSNALKKALCQGYSVVKYLTKCAAVGALMSPAIMTACMGWSLVREMISTKYAGTELQGVMVDYDGTVKGRPKRSGKHARKMTKKALAQVDFLESDEHWAETQCEETVEHQVQNGTLTKIQRSVAQLHVDYHNRVGFATHYADGWFMAPLHYFMYEGRMVEGSTIITMTMDGRSHKNKIANCSLRRFGTHRAFVDFCMFKFVKFSSTPGIRKHMLHPDAVLEGDIKSAWLVKSQGFHDVGHLRHSTTFERTTSAKYAGKKMFLNEICVYGETRPGMCGSPIVIMSGPLAGKVIAMHVAALNYGGSTHRSTLGLGIYLTDKFIDDVQMQMSSLRDLGPAPPVCHNEQSCLRPSPFHLDLSTHAEVHFQPAPLRGNDRRLDEEVPCLITKGFEKFGEQSKPFPKEALDFAMACLDQDVQYAIEEHPPRRTYTTKEAIWGCDDLPGLNPLDMSTSPGFSKLWGSKPDKRFLFHAEGKPVPKGTPMLPKWQAEYEKIEKLAMSGKATGCYWKAFLKDELRPESKVKAGKTRVVVSPDVFWTILGRKIFAYAISLFYFRAGRDSSAVGINVTSRTWDVVFRKQLAISEVGFAADFSRYDTSQHSTTMEAISNLWRRWSGITSKNKAANVIVDELINTEVIVGVGSKARLLKKAGGMPSGAFATTPMNTDIHALYQYVAWWHLCPRYRSYDAFHKFVYPLNYGDDERQAVSRTIGGVYNLKTYAKFFAGYNIKVTPADKDSEITSKLRPLKDLEFLKNVSRISEGAFVGCWVPVLDIESIIRMLRWSTTGEVGELIQRLDAAFYRLTFHPPQVYNMWRKKMTKLCKRAQIPYVPKTLDVMIASFDNVNGDFDIRPLEHEAAVLDRDTYEEAMDQTVIRPNIPVFFDEAPGKAYPINEPYVKETVSTEVGNLGEFETVELQVVDLDTEISRYEGWLCNKLGNRNYSFNWGNNMTDEERFHAHHIPRDVLDIIRLECIRKWAPRYYSAILQSKNISNVDRQSSAPTHTTSNIAVHEETVPVPIPPPVVPPPLVLQPWDAFGDFDMDTTIFLQMQEENEPDAAELVDEATNNTVTVSSVPPSFESHLTPFAIITDAMKRFSLTGDISSPDVVNATKVFTNTNGGLIRWYSAPFRSYVGSYLIRIIGGEDLTVHTSTKPTLTSEILLAGKPVMRLNPRARFLDVRMPFLTYYRLLKLPKDTLDTGDTFNPVGMAISGSFDAIYTSVSDDFHMGMPYGLPWVKIADDNDTEDTYRSATAVSVPDNIRLLRVNNADNLFDQPWSFIIQNGGSWVTGTTPSPVQWPLLDSIDLDTTNVPPDVLARLGLIPDPTAEYNIVPGFQEVECFLPHVEVPGTIVVTSSEAGSNQGFIEPNLVYSNRTLSDRPNIYVSDSALLSFAATNGYESSPLRQLSLRIYEGTLVVPSAAIENYDHKGVILPGLEVGGMPVDAVAQSPIDGHVIETIELQMMTGVLLGQIPSLIKKSVDVVRKVKDGDRPDVGATPESFVRTSYPNFAIGKDDVTRCSTLALAPGNVPVMSPDTFGSQPTRDVYDCISKFTLLTTVNWATTQEIGTELYFAPISPIFKTPTAALGEIVEVPALTYFSLPCLYWQGPIKLRIEVVASAIHKGKIGLMTAYGDTASPGPLEIASGQYLHELDIMPGGMSMEVTLDYLTTTPVKKIANGNLNILDYSCGVFSLKVVNRLVTMSSLAPSVQVNIYVAAAPGFKLYEPGIVNATLTPGYLPTVELQMEESNEGGVKMDNAAQVVRGPDAGVSHAGSKALGVMGAEAWSLVSMAARPQLILSATWDEAQPTNTVIAQFRVPFDFLTSRTIRNAFERTHFSKFDVKIKVTVNGTTFHQGRLICTWAPLTSPPEYQAWQGLNRAAQTFMQHSFLDPAGNSSVEMLIPYAHFKQCLPNASLVAGDDSLGTFTVSVFNPLATGGLEQAPVSVVIYAWFVNSNFTVMAAEDHTL
nr:polyprotein [Mute swan feces associated picorna-like virus 9]